MTKFTEKPPKTLYTILLVELYDMSRCTICKKVFSIVHRQTPAYRLEKPVPMESARTLIYQESYTKLMLLALEEHKAC